MNWLQDSKSAILRNQPTCCTYEFNPRSERSEEQRITDDLTEKVDFSNFC